VQWAGADKNENRRNIDDYTEICHIKENLSLRTPYALLKCRDAGLDRAGRVAAQARIGEGERPHMTGTSQGGGVCLEGYSTPRRTHSGAQPSDFVATKPGKLMGEARTARLPSLPGGVTGATSRRRAEPVPQRHMRHVVSGDRHTIERVGLQLLGP
jgi:hypothetical protein